MLETASITVIYILVNQVFKPSGLQELAAAAAVAVTMPATFWVASFLAW